MNKVKIKSAVISALILILISAFGNLNAQSFSASVNSTTVGVNEPFQVSFQFNGDDVSSIRNFKAPDFKGFRVLSGPNQSQSVQIINGSMSASLSFSY
ncbi:MAG: BatD family protein, partial [Bacillota bacterium]